MKVSFVIPTFNCVTWLPHAVSSCLQQTHKDIEVVIVNDASTDRTREYLDWLSKNEMRVLALHPGKNVGRSEARNLGNDAATGEIICVLDADDISTPNRAELTLKKFANSKADLIHGAATVIDAIGNPNRVLAPDVFDLDEAIRTMANRIVHSTVAYRKEFAATHPYLGGEITDLGLDDWAQQIEAAIGGAVIDYIPHRLACYRVLTTAVTKTRDLEATVKAKKAFIESLQAVAA